MNTIELAKKLYDHYEQSQRVVGYPGLLAVWALSELAVEANDSETLARCKAYLAQYPDHFDHPHYNFESYRVGGNGKAWLVMKGLFDEERENIRRYAEITLAAPKDEEGITCLFRNGQIQTWIDIAHCVTPFMLYAGLALKEERYIDFAAEQTFLMVERFLDRTCGLLHQCKGFLPNPERISSDHWGRGNGWGYLSLTVLVRDLPADSPHRPKAEKYFKDLSLALLAHQNAHGVWRQEVDCPWSWDESSATAFFIFGFGAGMRLGLLEKEVFDAPFRRAVTEMAARFIHPDFSVTMCCGGCLCPGEGDAKGTQLAYVTEKYPLRDNSHAFGPVIFALTEAARHGMTDLKVSPV